MKFSVLALFVIFLLPLALASPLATIDKVKHSGGLDFELGGESFSFKPVEDIDYVSWVEDAEGGFKWGLNFTLPYEDFKVSFSFEDKEKIVTGDTDYIFIINDHFLVDFQDVADSGLTVDLKNKKIEIKGFNNSLVGQLVSIDPLVTQSSTAGALYYTNQRKLLVNPIDGSLFSSFIGNNSCFVAWSNDTGASWALTNVSRGDSDEYCAIDVDDYGNVWSYFGDIGATTLYGRLLGWNSTGWDVGAAWNITSYSGIATVKTCGDSIGVFYSEPAMGSVACFKACRGIAGGSCNQTGLAFWNSTNQTTNSFCSVGTAGVVTTNAALDCVNGDFVAVADLSVLDKTGLYYGKNLLDGNYLWNTEEFTFTHGSPITADMPSLAHNSTTVFLAGKTIYGGSSRVYYRECSAGTGCNVTSNWTSDLLLSTVGVDGGLYGLQVGELNASPVVAWNENINGSSSIAGAWYNKSSSAWGGTQPLAFLNGQSLRWPCIPVNSTNATDYPFIFLNNTASEVWSSNYDFLAPTDIRVRAYDELSNTQINFDVKIYNDTALDEYADEAQVWRGNQDYPQGSVWFDFSKTGFNDRSMYSWIDADTTEDMKVFLLNSTDAIIVRFHIRTSFTAPIQNATVTVKKNIGGSIVTVGQKLSDFNGDTLFYLELNDPYFVLVSHDDYEPWFNQLTPTQNDYTITLDTRGGNYPIQGFPVQTTGDVYWWLSPFYNVIVNETANITFFVNATNNNLTYFWLNVTNETGVTLYSANISNSSSGGFIYYNLNWTAIGASNVTVYAGFSHSPDMHIIRTYFEGLYGGFARTFEQVRDDFGDSGLSDYGLALVFLLIALFIGAWVARVNLLGGLIVISIIIGFGAFTGAFDFPLKLGAGEGVANISGFFAIAFTFITVLALLFLRERI